MASMRLNLKSELMVMLVAMKTFSMSHLVWLFIVEELLMFSLQPFLIRIKKMCQVYWVESSQGWWRFMFQVTLEEEVKICFQSIVCSAEMERTILWNSPLLLHQNRKGGLWEILFSWSMSRKETSTILIAEHNVKGNLIWMMWQWTFS